MGQLSDTGWQLYLLPSKLTSYGQLNWNSLPRVPKNRAPQWSVGNFRGETRHRFPHWCSTFRWYSRARRSVGGAPPGSNAPASPTCWTVRRYFLAKLDEKQKEMNAGKESNRRKRLSYYASRRKSGRSRGTTLSFGHDRRFLVQTPDVPWGLYSSSREYSKQRRTPTRSIRRECRPDMTRSARWFPLTTEPVKASAVRKDSDQNDEEWRGVHWKMKDSTHFNKRIKKTGSRDRRGR